MFFGYLIANAPSSFQFLWLFRLAYETPHVHSATQVNSIPQTTFFGSACGFSGTDSNGRKRTFLYGFVFCEVSNKIILKVWVGPFCITASKCPFSSIKVMEGSTRLVVDVSINTCPQHTTYFTLTISNDNFVRLLSILISHGSQRHE